LNRATTLKTGKHETQLTVEDVDFSSDDGSISAGSNEKQTASRRKIDSEYVMNVLGCYDYDIVYQEEKLEEFIVLRAILDKNLPKLISSDQMIFQNILMDVFPKTPMPNPDLNQVHIVAKACLDREMLYSGDPFVQNVINLHRAMYSLHGVLVVGEAMSGKSKSL